MAPTITAFETSPDRGKGLARDMRVRWALEEVGQPYEVRLLSFAAMKEPAHLALHPFGQIPTYEEGDLALTLCLRAAAFRFLRVAATERERAFPWMHQGRQEVRRTATHKVRDRSPGAARSRT